MNEDENVTWVPYPKEPGWKSEKKFRCPKCGIEFEPGKPIYYACMQPDCPTGLGPTRI